SCSARSTDERRTAAPKAFAPRRGDGASRQGGSMNLSESTRARFAVEVAKYPADQKQSAVMACLAIVQQEQGWVSAEAEEVVAQYLGMPPIAVREVTTFYNMYNQQPVGRFKLNVCTNLPCQLRQGQHALEHLCLRLGIEEGGTSSDGL